MRQVQVTGLYEAFTKSLVSSDLVSGPDEAPGLTFQH